MWTNSGRSRNNKAPTVLQGLCFLYGAGTRRTIAVSRTRFSVGLEVGENLACPYKSL
ncbi:hypothetical protein EMIT0P12_40141 [Pseudomonas sp. IT-P12]